MEYKPERFILNNLCKFSDRETESDFMEYDKAASIKIVRFLTLLMGFIFTLFAISDYYFYGGGRVIIVSVGLRIVSLLITFATFSLVKKISRYDRALLLVSLTELAVFALYLVNLYSLKSRQPAIQFMSVMLFILTVFLIPNTWKNSMLAGCVIWVSYIIYGVIFGNKAESPSITQRAIYLGICLISCAVFLYGREVSRRRQFAAEKLLEFMSITDRMTGIFNRGRFEHVLGMWIKNMRHDPFCLLLFDIDDFKLVNDHFGHTTGDQVLVATTEVVTANIRDDDIFARWGGEEFVVLFSSTPIERAAELAERLRKAIEGNSCGEAGRITVSVGVVQYRRPETITDFVKRVDAKMYEAKLAGKNRVMAEY